MKQYKSRRHNKTNKLVNLILAVMIVFILWFIGSYIEIVCNNLNTAEYSDYNLIQLLINMATSK